MKTKALFTGFLCLVLSTIDAPELEAVKNSLYSNTQTTSITSPHCILFSPIFGNNLIQGINYVRKDIYPLAFSQKASLIHSLSGCLPNYCHTSRTNK